MSDAIPKYHSTNEAAAILGIGSDHLRKKIRDGEIQANKRCGRFVLTDVHIQGYLQGTPYRPKK